MSTRIGTYSLLALATLVPLPAAPCSEVAAQPLDYDGVPLGVEGELHGLQSLIFEFTDGRPDAWIHLAVQMMLSRDGDDPSGIDNSTLRGELATAFPWLVDPRVSQAWDIQDADPMGQTLTPVRQGYASLQVGEGFEVWTRPDRLVAARDALRADCWRHGWPRMQQGSTPTYWTVRDNPLWYDSLPYAPMASLWLQAFGGTKQGLAGGAAERIQTELLVEAALAGQAPDGGAAMAAANRIRDIHRVGFRLAVQMVVMSPTTTPPAPIADPKQVPKLDTLGPGAIALQLDTVVLIWSPPNLGDPGGPSAFQPQFLVPPVAGQSNAFTYPLSGWNLLELAFPTQSGTTHVTVERANPTDAWMFVDIPADAVSGTVGISLVDPPLVYGGPPIDAILLNLD